jgi:hypothetical protein
VSREGRPLAIAAPRPFTLRGKLPCSVPSRRVNPTFGVALSRTAPATLSSVLKTVLVAGLAVSIFAGAGALALRTAGDNTKATFDTLNKAFAHSEPDKEKASPQAVSYWVERYKGGRERHALS